MSRRLDTAARWGLVLATLATTTFAAFILLTGFMFWPDRSLVAALTAFNFAPHATIQVIHSFDFFLAILIWIVPTTSAIAFAMRKPQRSAFDLAVSISILLFAIDCFFLGRRDHSAWIESIAIIYSTAVLSTVIFSFVRSSLSRGPTFVNVVCVSLLFGLSVAPLSRRAGAGPKPKELWSCSVQRNQWQEMNTGSEYAATRQVAFVGDRVVVVFDAGFAQSQPSKEKWPVSTYRLVSLDLKTGAKIKETDIAGSWGSMPYIYPTQEGFLDVQSNPPLTLNPDLVSVSDSSGTARRDRRTSRESVECGAANCEPIRHGLGKNTLQLRQGHFQVVDSAGHVHSGGKLDDWGTFAGASADGRRFAIQSSYTEGDPDFVVYEYFTIYDAENGNVASTIHMIDLPARQSWSALSPDGRYFIAGNPNKLTLYELP